MYIDDSQKDIIADSIDKDGKTVKDIHAMTYEEACAITGNGNSTTGIRNTGSYYWVGSAGGEDYLSYVRDNGGVYSYMRYCWGVRPVVSLKAGVYIASGDGTETSPYVLGIETTK